MQTGDEFEIEQLRLLQEKVGEDRIYIGGIIEHRGRQTVQPLPMDRFKTLFGTEPPAFIAQLEIALPAMEEARFLQRFGLSPDPIALSTAKPDLIEVAPTANGRYSLRVWDFKASSAARHEHFIQVAFYTLLLEHVLTALGLDHLEVDAGHGVIRSRKDEPETFKLPPYRLAVEDFLRSRVAGLLGTPAAEAHFHVCAKCLLCEYVEGCREEADAQSDLSRVAYISSESKRRLRECGLTTHQDLARLDPVSVQASELRLLSHDLSLNLERYVASAQALDDGAARTLAASTLQMPWNDDVRVVLSAEKDSVTDTVFALGIKSYEGWDPTAKRPIGIEKVFIAERRDAEEEALLPFLRTLNDLMERADAANREIAATPLDDEPDVRAAAEALAAAERALIAFREKAPARLYKARAEHQPLLEERTRLEESVRVALDALKQARKDTTWERKKRQKTLHFYIYDTLDLEAIKSALERRLLQASPALRREMVRLVRLFPPETALPDADTFRTMPGTVVASALRQLVALPAPYLYDLETVSTLYQPQSREGEDQGYTYRPPYGFGWRHTNQIAFERIHDVWENKPFETSAGAMTPPEVLAEIERVARNKLRATDSIIRRLKQDHRTQREAGSPGLLLLKKEPFRLHSAFDPTDFELVDALRVFSLLEAALAELQTKHLHTLSVEDRAARFEAIRGLRYLPERDEQGGGVLWFTFDPACRDAKFAEGDWSLVVTPEDEPEVLIHAVDGPLFAERAGWRYKNFRVTLETYDLAASPPQVALRPDNPGKFREALELAERPDRAFVLDKLYEDFLTERVLSTLARLQDAPEAARHVGALLQHGTIPGWRPFFRDVHRVEYDLRKRITATTGKDGRKPDPNRVLNDGQWRALRGVFFEPLTMIWGPPGTGKTHTVAHILIAYALAARRAGCPYRILVTAATHHAIVNVLKKTAELAERYGLSGDDLNVAKLGKPNGADAELPESVTRIAENDLSGAVVGEAPRCLIVGGTVWSLYKTMLEAPGPGRPFFDVVLVDEASQLRLPDAIIAFASSRPEGSIILSGDDKQLPPIVQGIYPEEHQPVLSSVFAFARHKMEKRAPQEPGIEDRMLFQLTWNFRMSEPITAYPRAAIYNDYVSAFPHLRIETLPLLDADAEDEIDFLLHPERPVVLAWYTPPQSFTVRNPIEADVAARLILRLSQILIDGKTGAVYTPEAFARDGAAVLSPHRAQNATIRAALARSGFGAPEKPMPLVDTVEKLQGKERDAVVVSYGVADAEYADAEAGFLLSRNRFNVAATRARAKLVVLCSDVVLDAVPDDRQVLLESMMLKQFRQFCDDGRREAAFAHPGIGSVTQVIQWKAFDRMAGDGGL